MKSFSGFSGQGLFGVFDGIVMFEEGEQACQDENVLDFDYVYQRQATLGVLDGGIGRDEHPDSDRVDPVYIGEIKNDFFLVQVQVFMNLAVEKSGLVAPHDFPRKFENYDVTFETVCKFHDNSFSANRYKIFLSSKDVEPRDEILTKNIKAAL